MGEVSNQLTKANIHSSVWNVTELTLNCDEKWHFFDKPEFVYSRPLMWVQESEPYPTYIRQRDWQTKKSMPQCRGGR